MSILLERLVLRCVQNQAFGPVNRESFTAAKTDDLVQLAGFDFRRSNQLAIMWIMWTKPTILAAVSVFVLSVFAVSSLNVHQTRFAPRLRVSFSD